MTYPFPQPVRYPKWKYHPALPPKLVKNEEEENVLLNESIEWGDHYVFQAYPKMLFRQTEKGVAHLIVKNPEEEQRSVADGWSVKQPEPSAAPAKPL